MVDQSATSPGPEVEPGDAVVVRGLTKSYGESGPSPVSTSTSPAARSSPCWGPTAPGRPPPWRSSKGFRQRDGGQVSVLGYDPGHLQTKFRRRLGIVLQSSAVDPYLTVEEMIAMFAHFYPHPRPVDEVIELVGLSDKRTSRVMKLSGASNAASTSDSALVGDPDLLFLDEPTTGFDPSARREAWEVVRTWRRWARPCCSPPTTWTKRSRWPTGWR